MMILDNPINLKDFEDNPERYFEDMIKCVADIDKKILAVDAELHSDLEHILLANGSNQESLYGFNVYFDGEIEYESMINPPRNREAGYPRGGRYISDPRVREVVEEIVRKWIIC